MCCPRHQQIICVATQISSKTLRICINQKPIQIYPSVWTIGTHLEISWTSNLQIALNSKCNVSGQPLENKLRMPLCYVLTTIPGRCGERGGHLSGPGKFCIHKGRHHTNNFRTLKKHHINTCQVTSCQGQTPHGNVNKNCSTDVMYGCMNTMNNFNRTHPGLLQFLQFQFDQKTKPIIQGIKTLLLIFTLSVS